MGSIPAGNNFSLITLDPRASLLNRSRNQKVIWPKTRKWPQWVKERSCSLPGSNRRPCPCEGHVITTTLRKQVVRHRRFNSIHAPMGFPAFAHDFQLLSMPNNQDLWRNG